MTASRLLSARAINPRHSSYKSLLLLSLAHTKVGIGNEERHPARHLGAVSLSDPSCMHITSLLMHIMSRHCYYIHNHKPWSRLATRHQQHFYYATSDQNPDFKMYVWRNRRN
eukprot:4425113-Pyramimonas_sp.AAC.1